MRRGLMAWDANEVPVSTIEARQASLRQALKEQGLDAFIAYTNIARPAAVSWLSGFTPYWSEGLYYLPAEGQPQFATALSKRVAEWIGGVMAVGEVIPTPRPGEIIAKHLADSNAKKIGILEFDDLPAAQAKALLSGAPNAQFVDASEMFGPARAKVDDAERALVERAATLAHDCMASIDPAQVETVQDLFAPCEKYARMEGAEEVFLAAVPDLTANANFKRTDTADNLGEAFTLRISLAYKAAWVRLTQSFSRSAAGATDFDRLQQVFDGFEWPADADTGSLLDRIFHDNGAKLVRWQIEQPKGGYPLTVVAGSGVDGRRDPQGPAVISVHAEVSGSQWLAARTLF